MARSGYTTITKQILSLDVTQVAIYAYLKSWKDMDNISNQTHE